ncbi:hypothetical protein K2173_008240 [Erythroxylum novogranatense]|uniref:non-specific serine/threonine protein kinase n=1 Tax=Erythroxylum novogranatense TaxID=1862640 RepID=A0AAV8TSF0_9ROSI|nr:hypothetical protein K2173_008240 [Erythroxylum novogranatense]
MVSFILLLLVLCNGLVDSLNNEGYALLSFKQSVYEDPEGSLSNWNSSDVNPCSWNGITCKGGRVVSVSIPKKKLYGVLPSALGYLSDLRHVNLRNNRFFGSLPAVLFQAQGLQSLVLYGNSLSGSLPDEIGKLSYLQFLDLSQNFLNGSLPISLVRCKRLRTLDLSQNNFTGLLPQGFGTDLVSLEKLDMSFNKFNGSIPSDIGNLSSLQGTADFSHNLFSGSIPASLGNLPEKVYIDLTYNNLSGAIPQNGALMNRGPTAFIGNPGLYNVKSEKTKGLSKSAIIAIIASDIIGICLVGLLFSYCYSRVFVRSRDRDEKGYGYEKGVKGRNECFCFRKDESETLSENVEQHDLVPLDSQVAFNLDELLKASAFVLGKSGIGIVYKVVLEDGLTLAVRRLGEGGSQRFKEFQTEVEAIGKLRHPNIVTLRAYYWSVDEKLLIYDYVPNGSLTKALHGKPGMVSFTPLLWSIRLKIIRGIAKGLVYLHEFSPKKYVHGDLKPSNILLEHNMEPKIADFGLGRLANIAGGSPTLQSTRIAVEKPQEKQQKTPEALKVVKPSQKWDVYSYGVLLLEMITGRYPVVSVGASEMDLVQWIELCIEEQKPLGDVLDPTLSPEADKEEEIVGVLKIAMACVHSSPERRPTMRHVSDALNRLVVSSD